MAKGVFSDFRVILVVSKHEQFARLLKAGGGVILDVNPPYEGCKEALSATHCFVDQKKAKLSKTDYKTLSEADIPVMSIMYLNSYLTSEISEPTKYLVPID
jgi:topoisomerase (DNA) II binding protein 1